MTGGAIMGTKRTARLCGSPEWERAKRRRRVAAYLDEACGRSEGTLKGLAACAGVPDTKLRAMRRGDHGADLATVLGLPADVRDAFLERVGVECEREWVELCDAESGEIDAVIERLRDAFEEAMRELRSVARERRVSPEAARRLLGPVRTARRLLTGIEVLAERALRERGVSVEEDE